MSTVNPNSPASDLAAVSKDRAPGERFSTDWARDGGTGLPVSGDWARDGNAAAGKPGAAATKARNAKKLADAQEQDLLVVTDEDFARVETRGPGIQLAQLGTASTGADLGGEKLLTAASDSGEEHASAGWGREAPTHEFALPEFNSLYALAAGGLALASGISGAGAASVALAGGPAPTGLQALKVVAFDGLIAGAKIYVDRNGDGKVDASEKVGETDEKGVARLNLVADDLKFAFIAVGGTNADTGLPNTMQLTATLKGNGVVVLSPVSSLIAELQSHEGMGYDTAVNAAKVALGLRLEFDLASYDPSVAVDQPDALLYQKAGAQIATLGSDALLSASALVKLAKYIASTPVKLDLGDVDTLKAIYGTDASTVIAVTDAARANHEIVLASKSSAVTDAQTSAAAPVINGLQHDTGSSSLDKISNDPRLNVAGLNTAAHLEYSVDGGTTWVAADSFAPNAGSVSVQARLKYDNGLVTAVSNSFDFTFSVAAPVQPTLALQTDSGVASVAATASDHITNVAKVDIGAVDSDAVLEYSSDQVIWSTTMPAAHEGANDVYARQSYALTGATSPVTHLSFTLDSAAQAGTAGLASNVLGAEVLNDTGVTGDGITSNAYPTLSGQTEANAAKVTVVLGGHSYDVAAADLAADGHWTLTVTNALADDRYIPTVSVVDAAGNTGDATPMAAITIDTIVPVAGTAALSAASDTGFASDDGLTSQSHPTITGIAEALANVSVDVDGNIYRTTADAAGRWSVLVTTALDDGEYTPLVTVTDRAGNPSDEVDGTPFTVYATAPQETTPTGLSPDDGVSETVPFQDMDVTLAGDADAFLTDGITSNPLPLVVGNVDAPGTVVIMRLNGVTYTTMADDAGDWSIQIPDDNALDDGVYVPGLLFIDPAGNQTHLSGNTLTIDTTAPDDATGDLLHDEENDTGLNNDDGVTNNASAVFEGDTEAFAWVSVDLGGTVMDAVQADESGHWQVTADGLDDGTFTPIFTVSDLAGNVTVTEGNEITIDTTAPIGTTGVMLHDIDNDTGVSQADGITNNSSPILEGQTEANAHVLVDVGGTVFETDADENGFWSVTADALDDGDYTPLITVTDLAGNVSDAVEGESFTVLTVGPDEGTAELVHDDVSDTGVDVEDNITANNMPELFGTAGAPNALVTVDFNGVLLTTTADDNGDWVLKVNQALDDGDYVPLISVSDVAGNVTETEGTPFTIDTQAPTADSVTAELVHDDTSDTGVDPEDGITNNNLPELTGTADPLAFVHVDLLDAGGSLYAGFDTQADENGDWTQALESPLDDGTYTPMVSVIDLAGNQSAEIPGVAFTVDTTAPIGTTGVMLHDLDNDTGVSQADGITNNNAPILEGQTEANAHVLVDVGGTVFETDADEKGFWSVTADALDDGDYTPLITVTDLAGNVSDAVEGESFTVLTAIPEVADGGLTQDSINDTGAAFDDGVTNNNRPSLSGTADAGAAVTVEIGDQILTATADALGVWTVQVTNALPDGDYTPLITVSDVAGNVSDPFEGALILIDTRLDPVTGGITHDDVSDTGLSTDDGITNNKLPVLSGTVEALATVVVTLNQAVYETVADDAGFWEIAVDAELPDGTYTPTLTVTDLAGNTSTTNGETLTIDTLAAFSSVGLPGNLMVHVGELTDFNPLANMVTSGEVLVEDYSGTLPLGLSINPVSGLIEGLATATGMSYITLTSSDLAGNTAQAYFQVAVTALDKTANTSVNNIDPEKAAGYLGTDAAEHINVYASANDVLLAGAGNDLFQMFKPEALGFARADGGAGVDQMKFSGVAVVMDFSAFNNIDGSGQVIEHVEEFNFAGTQSDVSITAADIFALHSDILDVDGTHSLVRFMSSANNGGTVTIDAPDVLGGLTQVGAVDAFGASGGAKSGASADRYTKFTGVYTDGNGDHLVELLLQHGLTAA